MTDAQVTTAIANIADGTPNTALELRDLFTELFNRSPKTGTIVIKDVSNAYITANFDGTGLGINLEAGFAIVNGANGTRNWAERVPIAYGGTMLTMGATGGSPDAVLVTHTHTVDGTAGTDAGTGTQKFTTGTQNESGGSFGISTEGVSGVGKNMQPYIVTLVTMKL